MTKTLTHEDILKAQMGFLSLSGFSFKEPQVRHSLRRNLHELNPLVVNIKTTLDEIRDDNIKRGKDGNPKKKIVHKYNGKGVTEDGGWDWEKDGQVISEIAQRAYLDKEIEVEVFPIEDEWLSPCWRYYVDKERSEQSIREEYFLTYSDTCFIEYAIVYKEEEESLENLDKQKEESHG
ncbi:hypothetical protein LCGC14_0939220 [marine sediment metagenome]|uniref:Uncharacterized protein n=1 Tax=marine sediment metagenome TaxID=412755 RepID=A0A0F9RRZ3_9ZZZZ